MLKRGCLLLLLALGAAGCGGEPPPKAPAPTVFDPLVDKKAAVPAALEAAQAEHDAAIRRQTGPAEGEPPAEARR